jgi:hypothetical protein
MEWPGKRVGEKIIFFGCLDSQKCNLANEREVEVIIVIADSFFSVIIWQSAPHISIIAASFCGGKISR